MNKLTVFFEEPFWVGVFEQIENGKLETAKVVFGSEPKDYTVYDFIVAHYFHLEFSRPLSIEVEQNRKINPKRLQRKIREQTKDVGIGTKAQQALKAEHELKKAERKTSSKQQRECENQVRFEQRQEKKKEKHKGH